MTVQKKKMSAIYKRVLAQKEVDRVFWDAKFTKKEDGTYEHRETGLQAVNPLMLTGCYFFAGERNKGKSYDFESRGSNKPIRNAEELGSIIKDMLHDYQESRAIRG